MITSSTSSGATRARLTLSRTTIAPSSVAANPFNEPRNFPTGVLTALIITASRVSLINAPEELLKTLLIDFVCLRLLFTQRGVKEGQFRINAAKGAIATYAGVVVATSPTLNFWSATITLKALANLSPGFALKPWVKKGTFISSQL